MHERIRGCLLGAALGDALGAPYEGGPVEQVAQRMISAVSGERYRYTDDTQMTMDLAESLIRCGTVDPDDLARTFAAGYSRWRGYGPGAAKILKRIRGGMAWAEASRSVYADGSFGNGAAMRAPLVGVIFDGAELEEAVKAASKITHAHPQGIDGARVVARVASAAARDEKPTRWLDVAFEAAATDEMKRRLSQAGKVAFEPAAVAEHVGNGIVAVESVPTAMLVASRTAGLPFEELIDFCRRLGGDVDTIGSMASAIYGAYHGAKRLPQAWLGKVEGVARLDGLSDELAKIFSDK